MGKVTILKQVLGGYRLTGGNYHFNCPNISHPSHRGGDIDYKLAVDTNKNQFHCWVCPLKGHVMSLLNQYGNRSLANEYADLSFFNEREEKDFGSFSLPYGFTEEFDKFPDQYGRVAGRIGAEALEFYGAGVSSIFENAPVLPFRARDGTIHYWLIDNYKIKKPKYVDSFIYSGKQMLPIKKPKGFLNAYGIRMHLPLIIVEGWYDMASPYPYTNVEPLLGKVMSDALFWHIVNSPIPFIYLMLDSGDKVAVRNMKQLKHKFETHGKQSKIIYSEQKKDPNELKKEGALFGILKDHFTSDWV